MKKLICLIRGHKWKADTFKLPPEAYKIATIFSHLAPPGLTMNIPAQITITTCQRCSKQIQRLWDFPETEPPSKPQGP